MRVSVSRATVTLLAMLLTVACSSEERRTIRCEVPDPDAYYGTIERTGKALTTFYVNNGDEPEYLDPGLATDGASNTLVNDLFEGLAVKHPKDVHPVQGTATHWDVSDDNTVWRFYLREDAKWSDGKPVVAGDYVYAWTRVLTAATGARNATILYPIKNGAAFHQGKLKVLTRAEPLRSAPDAEGGERLPAGTALKLAEAPKPDAKWVEVEVFGDLPSFQPKPAPAPKPAEAPEPAEAPKPEEAPKPAPPKAKRGFVAADALALDGKVLGVRAQGDHVLEVELEQPTPYFIELVMYASYYPVRRDVIEHFAELGDVDKWTRPGNIVTNGPYTLESWKFRYQLTFVANPHWYDRDKLKFDRIVVLEVPDYNGTLNLYRAGEIDWMGENLSLPQTFMDMLESKKDFSRSRYLSSYWYEFNTTKKPVDDVRVRHALDLGVDKQLLVDKITRADQVPARHYVPPWTGSGYSKRHDADVAAGRDPFSGKGHDFDPELGRQLLAEAGYPVKKQGDGWIAEGFPSLEILYNTSEGHRAIAVAIQDMWKTHLGVTATLRNEEWKVLIKNVRDGHFQVVRYGWVGDYNHPHSWMDTFLSYSHNNNTHWKNEKFDALVEKAARTADPDASIALYREAEELAVREMSKLPLYFYTKSNLIKPWIKGYWPNASNDHYMRWMWVDSDWCKPGRDNTPAYAPREFPKPGRIAAPPAKTDAGAAP